MPREIHETRTAVYRGAKIVVWKNTVATFKCKVKEKPDGEWTNSKDLMASSLDHALQRAQELLDLWWGYCKNARKPERP